jgi:hypothetical protein
VKRWLDRIVVAVLAALCLAVPADAQVSIFGNNVVGRQFTVYNSGATGTSNAYLEAKVQGTAGGDPHTRYTIPSGTSWYSGVDNSASDVFDIGTGTTVGSARYFEIASGANAVVRFGPDISGQTIITAGTVGHQLLVLANGGATATSLTVGSDQSGSILILRANNTGWMNLTADGRFYGTALHNNAGAVTGTTNQYIASGTYTPTLTAVANVAASTARLCQWTRVGNVVNVSCQMDVDPTTTATLTQLGISLPIASALANSFELNGTGAAPNLSAANAASAAVIGDATNDRAQLQWTPVDVTNQTWTTHFQYVVL